MQQIRHLKNSKGAFVVTVKGVLFPRLHKRALEITDIQRVMPAEHLSYLHVIALERDRLSEHIEIRGKFIRQLILRPELLEVAQAQFQIRLGKCLYHPRLDVPWFFVQRAVLGHGPEERSKPL